MRRFVGLLSLIVMLAVAALFAAAPVAQAATTKEVAVLAPQTNAVTLPSAPAAAVFAVELALGTQSFNAETTYGVAAMSRRPTVGSRRIAAHYSLIERYGTGASDKDNDLADPTGQWVAR